MDLGTRNKKENDLSGWVGNAARVGRRKKEVWRPTLKRTEAMDVCSKSECENRAEKERG